MKQTIERQAPRSYLDYLSLAIATVGVGYLPLAPGTWGSAVGVGIYIVADRLISYLHLYANGNGNSTDYITAWLHAFFGILFLLLILTGIWGSGRSISFLGNSDPSQTVIDEVMGQLVVFFFVPFGITWPFVLTGFLLFRLFDIWKPYPIDALQILPGGLGICADDLIAGVYAGVCLAIGYAVYLSV